MSDELLHLLNAPVDDRSALARMWGEYAMSGIDESSDSSVISDGDSEWVTARSRLGLAQTEFSVTMRLTCSNWHLDVAIELPAYAMQEKDDILKASSFRCVSCKFVHSIFWWLWLSSHVSCPGPGRWGGYRHPCIAVAVQ